MNKQDILTLYQYNAWSNAKILDAASTRNAGTIACARLLPAWKPARDARA